jgi:hypothetical protein
VRYFGYAGLVLPACVFSLKWVGAKVGVSYGGLADFLLTQDCGNLYLLKKGSWFGFGQSSID